MTKKEKVQEVAKLIKKEVEDFYEDKNIFSCWPPQGEVKAKNVSLPPLLKNFLESLLTNNSNSKLSDRVERLTKSFGQNIVYATSRGKVKTIKHVQLGLFTKRRTGSKLLISCLNRLGHCLNYDEINSVETSFAEIQAYRQIQRSFVPTNLQSSTINFYNLCIRQL